MTLCSKFLSVSLAVASVFSARAFASEAQAAVPRPQTLTIPASASIHGQNTTFFHSDLWLFNSAQTTPLSVTAVHRCLSGQTCSGVSPVVNVPARRSILFSDVLVSLFGDAETAGAIELTYDAAVGGLTAISTTYTPALPAATSGTSIPALPQEAARTRGVHVGLGASGGDLSTGFRSNAGVYNPNSTPTFVTMVLQAANGSVLGAYSRTWAAHEAFQLNNIFAVVGAASTVTANARLVVESTLPVFSYVTVLDNQSGDQVYVAAADDLTLTGPNLVNNGAFDSTVMGWNLEANADFTWSSFDVNGDASSGSGLLTNHHPLLGQNTNIFQCVPVTSGTYDYTGRFYFPTGQQATGIATGSIFFFDGSGCLGNNLVGESGGSENDTPGQWNAVQRLGLVAPAGTQSVQISLSAYKNQAGGSLQMYIDGIALRESAPRTLTIPASASIHGQNGTFFHTDLWLLNGSNSDLPVVARHRCLSGQTCQPTAIPLTIPAGSSLLMQDVIGSFFVDPETAGAIELTYNAALGVLVAGTRTYTPSSPSPTNGTSIPAFAQADAKTKALHVGLGGNGGDLSQGFRSNAGVYNPNTTSVSVTMTLLAADGSVLGAPFTRTWGPNEAFQLNNIFAVVGAATTVTRNATLLVSSSLPVFSYVTVLDNQSGDQVYVAASDDVLTP